MSKLNWERDGDYWWRVPRAHRLSIYHVHHERPKRVYVVRHQGRQVSKHDSLEDAQRAAEEIADAYQASV